jgi:peptidoglycan hydrolase CwlO-like protein
MRYPLIHIKKPCWALITEHAVSQFISRWVPEATREDAELGLIDLLNSAKKLPDKTPLGDDMYASGEWPDVRLVIKDRNVCVTVLPPGRNFNTEYEFEVNEILEARERAKSNLEKQIADLETNLSTVEVERQEAANNAARLLTACRKIRREIDSLKDQIEKGNY